MKLIEAESTGPVEGDDALVTPPRPPRRRVSVSLLFTLTVLVGTVVTIYAVFPARHNALMTEAIEHHRDTSPAWEFSTTNPAELRGWMIGVLRSKDVPVPGEGTLVTPVVIGARRLTIFHREAALIRLDIGDNEVTYLVQHAQGIAPEHSERRDGELRAVAWRKGPFTIVAVGADATAARWRAALHAN
jgi:hypothetical protein